jgi:hypothetical protein
MPHMTGGEVLAEIKRDPSLACIPIVVLTTSIAPKDICQTARLGVNGYIQKPNSYNGYLQMLANLRKTGGRFLNSHCLEVVGIGLQMWPGVKKPCGECFFVLTIPDEHPLPILPPLSSPFVGSRVLDLFHLLHRPSMVHRSGIMPKPSTIGVDLLHQIHGFVISVPADPIHKTDSSHHTD